MTDKVVYLVILVVAMMGLFMFMRTRSRKSRNQLRDRRHNLVDRMRSDEEDRKEPEGDTPPDDRV